MASLLNDFASEMACSPPPQFLLTILGEPGPPRPDRRTLFVLTLSLGPGVVGLLALGLRPAPATSPPKEKSLLTLTPFGRDFRLPLLALVVLMLGSASVAFLLAPAGIVVGFLSAITRSAGGVPGRWVRSSIFG